ncbi:arginine--tRNA ligase [candidate division TA06 bacterium]|uniref:Arginine--tRNA ligase n=1 Tax=candidate division TA06 bacterium TaxID=2250710 RepID=A0A933MJY4_UNCT6|nr:arginine--tRNA ligase [candidate division TA06 bacterium]
MIKQYLQDQIIQAAQKALSIRLEPKSIVLERPKQTAHGDWATSIALSLAKEMKAKPRDIAQKICDSLALDPGLVSKTAIAGPGFINFTLASDWFYQELTELLSRGIKYGQSQAGNGQKAQVEFVSSNPTGPLTVGHGRGAAIGDSLSRLLEAQGYQVTREYYFNDAGLQMKKLAQSVFLRYQQALGKEIVFPDDVYHGDYIKEIAEACRREKGDNLTEVDLDYFKQSAVAVIFGEIKKTLARMGIVFDVYYNESTLYQSGEIESTLQALKDKGLTYESEGAVWFKATQFGAEKDRVLLRSTGEPTYRLPDIAYHLTKFKRGFDLVIDVFGSDHQATYPDVLAALGVLGCDPSRIDVRIHQFVTLMRGGEQVKMSTRKATYITLDELMDEVGSDAARYFFLMRRMESHLDFDLDLAKKKSDENPVFYVQYAHARICSIMQHAGEKMGVKEVKDGKVVKEKSDLGLLKQPEEIKLIKSLLEFPELVQGAAQSREPHRIPTYLQELAGIFHNFYHQHRVVTDDQNISNARLDLCQATRTVIANGLGLLGVSAPEKM